MLFIQCTGTELNTHKVCNIENDISFRLKSLFYQIFKKLSSKEMNTAKSVRVIQCRIETNVAD